MKLNNILIISILINNCAYAKEGYNYINIGECMIPLMKKLELISSDKSGYIFSEKDHNFDGKLKSPVGITIEKNLGMQQKRIDNIIKIGNLNKKIVKNGYLIYTDGKKDNNVFFVILNKSSIVTVNYLRKDLDFLLDYCTGHPIDKP